MNLRRSIQGDAPPQLRLTGRFRRLTARGKSHPKVATAIARELTGFVWDIARQVAG